MSYSSSGRITMPPGSFGKKYVDFGGIVREISATSITVPTGVGNGRNQASY